MSLFRKKRKTRVWNPMGLFKKEPYFSKRGIHFLNMAQFLGVVNDNVFKFLLLFFFIDLKGVERSSEILFWVGVVYVLPFLLFSSAAGVLADRFSKKKMIVFIKFTEVILMILGIFAFISKNEVVSYSLLFFLSIHAAIFGPPKYSIIPELVPLKDIPKANGLITSFTCLGIVLGTFLASALTQITGRNFPLAVGACVLIAILGFVSSLFIPKTEPKRSKKRINPLFAYEIYQTLREAKGFSFLLPAIFGASSFLFIGAFFQLNVIPYAIESLGFTEVGGGYLFLLSAVGIAIGSILAGKLCKNRIDLGLACFSGILLSVILFFIGEMSHPFSLVLFFVFFLGVCGGMYIVPMESFIQTSSPEQKRGQIIAANNFLSFCGVLIAPMLLYLFNGVLHLTSAQGFMIASILILIFVLVITSHLSGYFFSFLNRLFFNPFFQVKVKNIPFIQHKPCVLLIPDFKRVYLSLLSASNPNLHFYFPKEKKEISDLVFTLFSPIHFLYTEMIPHSVVQAFVKSYKITKEEVPCLLYPFFDETKEIGKVQRLEIFSLEVEKSPEPVQNRWYSKRKELIFSFRKLC